MAEFKVTVSSWGEVALDKAEVRKLMRAAGNDIRRKTSALIGASEGTGRGYPVPGGGRYRASASGQPPVHRTGALQGSLKTYVFKSGEGFAVRAREFYALFLEAGAKGGGNPYGGKRRPERAKRARGRYQTRVLAPRPFLDKVMTDEAATLNARVEKALRNGLTWKQTK